LATGNKVGQIGLERWSRAAARRRSSTVRAHPAPPFHAPAVPRLRNPVFGDDRSITNRNGSNAKIPAAATANVGRPRWGGRAESGRQGAIHPASHPLSCRVVTKDGWRRGACEHVGWPDSVVDSAVSGVAQNRSAAPVHRRRCPPRPPMVPPATWASYRNTWEKHRQGHPRGGPDRSPSSRAFVSAAARTWPGRPKAQRGTSGDNGDARVSRRERHRRRRNGAVRERERQQGNNGTLRARGQQQDRYEAPDMVWRPLGL